MSETHVGNFPQAALQHNRLGNHRLLGGGKASPPTGDPSRQARFSTLGKPNEFKFVWPITFYGLIEPAHSHTSLPHPGQPEPYLSATA